MPLYVYACPKGHVSDTIRRVAERHDLFPCPDCGATTELQVQTAAFDPKMGCDPGFPTAYEKWAKVHSKAAREK